MGLLFNDPNAIGFSPSLSLDSSCVFLDIFFLSSLILDIGSIFVKLEINNNIRYIGIITNKTNLKGSHVFHPIIPTIDNIINNGNKTITITKIPKASSGDIIMTGVKNTIPIIIAIAVKIIDMILLYSNIIIYKMYY